MDWNSATTKKHIKEAKAVGLTLTGEGKNAQYRTYRFNNSKKCKRKHKQEIATSSVRNNDFKCNQCFQIQLEKEAKAVGHSIYPFSNYLYYQP